VAVDIAIIACIMLMDVTELLEETKRFRLFLIFLYYCCCAFLLALALWLSFQRNRNFLHGQSRGDFRICHANIILKRYTTLLNAFKYTVEQVRESNELSHFLV